MARFGIEVKWGFLFLAMSLCWMLGEKLFGLHTTQIEKHAFYTNFYLIPVILIYALALIEKRQKIFNGIITWKQGFISSLILTGIILFLSPLNQIITHQIISPEYSEHVIAFAVETDKLSSPEAESYYSLKSYIVQSILGSLIMGAILSLILPLFLTRKQNTEVKVD